MISMCCHGKLEHPKRSNHKWNISCIIIIIIECVKINKVPFRLSLSERAVQSR